MFKLQPAGRIQRDRAQQVEKVRQQIGQAELAVFGALKLRQVVVAEFHHRAEPGKIIPHHRSRSQRDRRIGRQQHSRPQPAAHGPLQFPQPPQHKRQHIKRPAADRRRKAEPGQRMFAGPGSLGPEQPPGRQAETDHLGQKPDPAAGHKPEQVGARCTEQRKENGRGGFRAPPPERRVHPGRRQQPEQPADQVGRHARG